ncbi:SusC/RagA family TonB-linked outer membrane protein [Sinomicrobium soli]|uniref:SusC/RagA family TonB-linked outer membrane protein n=1 Tax=Sinomicrobium sp. N-1-3-6 TaxID=2219864 RepID=UPI00191BEC64|nr:TonB-dependent receptor [Sinomicrobium sp. N-1-3-6]
MTFHIFCYLILFSLFNPLLAADSKGQSLSDITVNLSRQEGLVTEILEDVEAQTDFRFIYDRKTKNISQKLHIGENRLTLLELLRIVSEKTGLRYKRINRYISIGAGDLYGTNHSFFHVVKGTVTDENGQPLPGASVVEKGTSKGTSTDFDGNFTIDVAGPESILLVSYMGYVQAEIGVRGRTSVTVTMQPDNELLDEVVVVGYGRQQRREVSSAISSFKPTQENARPVLGPDQIMQGRMPGVLVGSGGGTPGSNMRVSIRGIGSLSGQNEPLYVIDGIPLIKHNAAMYDLGEGMNPLAELNPNDIESVEVLKDAASAAIYGSRATNGVVIITTKSGKEGQSRLDVNLRSGVQYLPNLDKLGMAGSDLYLDVLNEAVNNYNQQNGYAPGDSNFVRYYENPYPGLPDTDWLDLVTRQAYVTDANISFSSGSEKTRLYLSGGYLNQEGVIKTNKFRKYTAKVNVSHNPLKWLEIGANTTASFTRNNRIPNGDFGSAIMLRSVGQRPFDRPYKPNGDYYRGGTEELKYHNNLQILNEQDTQLDNYRYLGNFYADFTFSPDLHLKSSAGADIIHTEDFLYYTENHPYGAGQGRILDRRRTIKNMLVENTLYFDKTLGNLKINALAGHSFQKVTTSTSYIDGRGFPSPSFDVISVASEIADASTGYGESALESYYSRLNLAWADKYLLSMSIRADGSSKFSPEKRYGAFPSVSAGWNISEEPFWKSEASDLKLRASFGATGNQDGIGSYAFQALMSGGANYSNNSGIAITTFGNPDLTWETAEQFNIGSDLSLFNGKLNLTADYFVKNTKNLLYSRPIHATSGFSSITSNIGSMQNKGVEFAVHLNQDLGPVQWTSDFNISFIKNKLTSLLGDEALLIGGNRTLQVGEEVGSFYLYKMLGIFQSDEEVPEPQYQEGVRAGDVHYEDLNGDGLINVDDRQIVGTSNPAYFGGWSNMFRYKGFDLSVFFTYSYGSEIYATWRKTTDRIGLGNQGFRKEVALERWTGPGSSNKVPRAIHGYGHNLENSSRFLEDGSFIRLRTLTLGYNLPASLLDKIGVSRLRMYLQGDNLYLWTRYSGIDPEVSKDYDARFLADDNMNLPQPRTISFGINATF